MAAQLYIHLFRMILQNIITEMIITALILIQLTFLFRGNWAKLFETLTRRAAPAALKCDSNAL